LLLLLLLDVLCHLTRGSVQVSLSNNNNDFEGAASLAVVAPVTLVTLQPNVSVAVAGVVVSAWTTNAARTSKLACRFAVSGNPAAPQWVTPAAFVDATLVLCRLPGQLVPGAYRFLCQCYSAASLHPADVRARRRLAGGYHRQRRRVQQQPAAHHRGCPRRLLRGAQQHLPLPRRRVLWADT
jgi:hypothetical protein